MGAPLRSRLQMDERRAQLLELGLGLFGTRAYDEVSIDDIAAAANVSKGLLYHYFGGKRDFYVETIKHAAQTLLDATEPPHDLPPRERAVAGINAYLNFVEDRAEAYVALITSGLGADPEVTSIVSGTRGEIVGRMMADLGLEKPRPVFRLALRSYIGAVEVAAVDWIEHRDIPRDTLVVYLAMTLRETLLRALELDPDAPVDPKLILEG